MTNKTNQAHLEQVVSLLQMQGMEADAEWRALMRPLLDGSQNLEQHRAMLEAMIARAQS